MPLLIDIAIVIFLGFYLLDGYRRGFLVLFAEFLGTALAFVAALALAGPATRLIHQLRSLPEFLEKSMAFFLVWLIAQAVVSLIISLLYQRIPEAIKTAQLNKLSGLLPSAVKGLLIAAIVVTLVISLPIQGQLRPAIGQSLIGRRLVSATQTVEQRLSHYYQDELTDTLTFLTTSPLAPRIKDEHEQFELHFQTTAVSVDEKSEVILFDLVNRERVKVGLKPLKPDSALQAVARAHARDMLARGYFAHDTPEGVDPFDRMEAAGIRYLTAGENLALAPTVELAHSGLMNSPKHKENILYPDFGHLGVGVIDAGIYGKMFVQEFKE
jgi:uncharacterized protein YkwD/uncharacterized membrane protein required for colicin V production